MISVSFTGLDPLIKNLSRPNLIEETVLPALKSSIAMVETNVKKRAPVDTAYLQGSIGGEGGYSYLRGLTAGVGTNVKYALIQEVSDHFRHRVGEAHYTEKGAKATIDYIKSQFTVAMKGLADKLTRA